MFEMSFRTTEDQPAKREGGMGADCMGDHLKNLALSILSFAFIETIQYNDN
jgi:hypothetical protein